MGASVEPLGCEPVALPAALNRILREAPSAARDQPPFASSAMDGFAVRAADLGSGHLTIVGESAAEGPMPAQSAPERRYESSPVRRFRRARTTWCRKKRRAATASAWIDAGTRERRRQGADVRIETRQDRGEHPCDCDRFQGGRATHRRRQPPQSRPHRPARRGGNCIRECEPRAPSPCSPRAPKSSRPGKRPGPIRFMTR